MDDNKLYELGENGIENKVYFLPGDCVTISKKLENKPIMMVLKKKTFTIKEPNVEGKMLIGIECGWFNKNQDFCTATFSTKDLVRV